MNKLLTPSNVIFILICLYAAYSLIPVMKNNLSQEGKLIPQQEYQVITKAGSEIKILFPGKKRTIAIFWATWCAPCKVEMSRLSSSVKDGKIPEGAIMAINPFERTEVVSAFLKEHSYPFTFLEDAGISKQLNVDRTPTTVFIEDQRVIHLSSGLSLTGIFKAEEFL